MAGVALVTGASSGIGRHTAMLLAKQGYTVYGASRRGKLPAAPREAGALIPLAMDVTRDESVQVGVAKILLEQGRIDLLVHAAGNGLYGPIECCTAEDARAQMDVNYFGALRLLNAVLPGMRERRSGRVVLVGSVGGVFAIPFQTLYSSSKAALAILCDGLRLELKPYNVQAALIEPGDVRTGFTHARRPVASVCPAYEEAMRRAVSRMERDEKNGMSPRMVAKAVVRVAMAKRPRAHTTVGGVYRVFMFLKPLLPARLVEALLYRMY